MPRRANTEDRYLKRSHGGTQFQFTKRLQTGRRAVVNLGTSDLKEARRLRNELEAQLILGRSIEIAKLEVLGGANRPIEKTLADPLSVRRRIHGLSPGEREIEVDLLEDAADKIWERAKERGDQPQAAEIVSRVRLAIGTDTLVSTYLDQCLLERLVEPSTEAARKSAVMVLEAKHPVLERITSRVAGDYVASLLDEGKMRRTVNSHVSHLSTYWRWMVSRELVSENVWRDKQVKLGTKKQLHEASLGEGESAWSVEEVRHILEAVKDKPFYFDCYLTLALTGMRIGDLAELRVEHFSPEARTLRIRNGKTENATRAIYLTDHVLEVIGRLSMGKERDAFIFADGDIRNSTKELKRSAVFVKRLNRTLHKLFPKYARGDHRNHAKTVHSLRKTFITAAERQRVYPEHLKYAVGHKRGNLTFDVYSSGPQLVHLREVFEAVARELGSSLSMLTRPDL